MELGHLLTRSGLTYPKVSSKVCHDSFCQLGSSVSLPWGFHSNYIHFCAYPAWFVERQQNVILHNFNVLTSRYLKPATFISLCSANFKSALNELADLSTDALSESLRYNNSL